MSADIQARFGGKNLMVVSPDVGGVVRARALAKRLDNAPLAIVDKRRERAGESEVMNIIGDVAGRFCILIDDIVDSRSEGHTSELQSLMHHSYAVFCLKKKKYQKTNLNIKMQDIKKMFKFSNYN